MEGSVVQSRLHLCCIVRGMQKAKQASLFSPTEKPKDQVIKLQDTQAELGVGPISLSPDTLTSLGLNG